MDLTDSSLVPSSKFKAQFINSRAFIGTCSFRDVCHFIFIHRNVFTYVLWIDSETKRMCVSFCSLNMFEEKLEIYMIEIIFPSVSFYHDKYSIGEIGRGLFTHNFFNYGERRYVVYFYNYHPSQLSTFKSLIQKVFNRIYINLQHEMLVKYLVNVSSRCLFFKFIPFDKRQHQCCLYYKNNIVETKKSSKTLLCEELNYFSPELLKKMCLFFIANYFPQDWVNRQMLPSKIIIEILNVKPYIGTVNQIKNEKNIMRINFNNIPYKL